MGNKEDQIIANWNALIASQTKEDEIKCVQKLAKRIFKYDRSLELDVAYSDGTHVFLPYGNSKEPAAGSHVMGINLILIKENGEKQTIPNTWIPKDAHNTFFFFAE